MMSRAVAKAIKAFELEQDYGQSPLCHASHVVEFQRVNCAIFPRAKLQPLITAGGGKLRVRISGQLMFDSEHSLGGHLKRHNNWEVHPVTGVKYCQKKTCSEGDWKDIEQ